MRNTTFKLGATGLLCLALAACGSMKEDRRDSAAVVTGGDVVALTSGNRIVTFNRADPQKLLTSMPLTGVPVGETLLGMDYRPADGKLYALATGGGIYTIDPATGAATKKSQLTSSLENTTPLTTLQGNRFAVDFNPVADRLRVVSDNGQNLRINVDNGMALNDGAINGVPNAQIVAGAYTNAYAGATATTLVVINGADGSFYLLGSPNNGTLTRQVPMGVPDPQAQVADFDIESDSNNGYAVMTVNGVPGFYWLDLANQSSPKLIGSWNGVETIQSFALWQRAK